MIRSFIITAIAFACSTSFALHKSVTHEVRGTETWVNIDIATGQTSKADLLFVVDNSGSMATHQNNFANQMSLISQSLSMYSDINAAVISSSMETSPSLPITNGKFAGPVLNSNSPDFAKNLATQVKLGEYGTATESFFDPIVAATSEPLISTSNANFLRADADLLVVIITDTEDQSLTNTAQSTFDHLTKLKPNNAISAMVVGLADPAKCSGETEWENQTGLKDFIALTKGSLLDICGNYASEIPKAIKTVKTVVSEVTLNVFPGTKVDYSSIRVTANNQLLLLGDSANGWTYNSKKNVLTLGTNIVEDDSIMNVKVVYKLIAL